MRVFVAGHRGMVGRAVCDRLRAVAGLEVLCADRQTLDLRDQQAVRRYLDQHGPDWVVNAAARVGGIAANMTYPAQFIYDNLVIATNLIHGSHLAGVQHLIQLGSSCIYPRGAAQPIVESELLKGALEPTNEPYAIAKIAAIKLCESYNREYGRDYRSLMPTNLYGPGDNYHPENAHVLPALMNRFHQAVETGQSTVRLWGTGTPRREFLHVQDFADAIAFVMQCSADSYQAVTKPMQSHINVGTGQDISIFDLAALIAQVTGFTGHIDTDPSRPDGTPQKLLDVSVLTGLGWSATIGLKDGIAQTYADFHACKTADLPLRMV